MTFGKVIQRLAIFPIPPRLARPAALATLITAAAVALLQVHSFAGVLAAAMTSAVVVLAIEALRKPHRQAR